MKIMFLIPFFFLFLSSCTEQSECNCAAKYPGFNPPKIVSTTPLNNATNIDLNYADFIIDFNKDMSSNYMSVVSSSTKKIFVWDPINKKRLYIIFQETLPANSEIKFIFNPSSASTKIQDTSGIPVENDTVVKFTTGSTTNPPFILSSSPVNGSDNIDINTPYIEIKFNQEMKLSSNFTINKVLTTSNEWTDPYTYRINFLNTLSSNTTYTFNFNAQGNNEYQYMRSTNNIRLKENTEISFTTIAQ